MKRRDSGLIEESLKKTISRYKSVYGKKPEVLRIHRYTHDLLKKEIARNNGDSVTEFMGVRLEVVE